MKESMDVVGIKHEVLGECTKNLDSIIGQMEDIIPQLEGTVKNLGESKEAEIIRGIIADAKVKVEECKENNHTFKKYMNHASLKMGATENRNSQILIDSYKL